MKAERLAAVALACAKARYPLAENPEPQDIDRTEAERFLAMLDAVRMHASVTSCDPGFFVDAAPRERIAGRDYPKRDHRTDR